MIWAFTYIIGVLLLVCFFFLLALYLGRNG